MVWGLGFRVWGLGFRVWGFGFWGLGFRVWGFGFWGLGFGVYCLGFGVWGLWFRVRGVGFGVWGLGQAGIQGARVVPIPLAVSFDTGFRRTGFGSAFVSTRHERLALVRLASSWRLGATLYPRP